MSQDGGGVVVQDGSRIVLVFLCLSALSVPGFAEKRGIWYTTCIGIHRYTANPVNMQFVGIPFAEAPIVYIVPATQPKILVTTAAAVLCPQVGIAASVRYLSLKPFLYQSFRFGLSGQMSVPTT